MGEKEEIDRAVELIYRQRLGGRKPDNAITESWLRMHFEQVSRSCREVFRGVCTRCPFCPCAARAVALANVDVQAPLLGPPKPPPQYGPPSLVSSTKLPPKPPAPNPNPPRKSPAVAMGKPREPARTRVVARSLKHLPD